MYSALLSEPFNFPQFHLEQAKLRSKVRIQDGRGTEIKSNLLLSQYQQLWAVQYGEIGS